MIQENGTHISKVIAVTETWAETNFDAKYTNIFKGYNIQRSDREMEKKEGDPARIGSRGGVLLLTTSDLPLAEIKKYSNGSTEVLIVEIPLLDTSVIVFYTHQGKTLQKRSFEMG